MLRTSTRRTVRHSRTIRRSPFPCDKADAQNDLALTAQKRAEPAARGQVALKRRRFGHEREQPEDGRSWACAHTSKRLIESPPCVISRWRKDPGRGGYDGDIMEKNDRENEVKHTTGSISTLFVHC